MESPFEGAAPYTGPLKTNTTAIVSILAAASGFICFFWGVGGILGLTLGFIAYGEVKRSQGRESGAGLAVLAMILGGLNLALTVGVFGFGLAQLATASRKIATPAPPSFVAPAPSPAATRPKPHRKPEERTSREATPSPRTIGTITVADLVPSQSDLATSLDSERAAAKAASQTLLLWLVQPNCKPCDGVAASLPDPRMQTALAHVRLLRIEVHAFETELAALAIPVEKIPGFVLLDAHNHARDFIHGGEWDADIAANIAPVLGKFVRGAYSHRREPWRPGAREGVQDDETPI